MAEFTGLLGDALGWMKSPLRTQQMQGIGGLLSSGLSAISDTDKKYQELYAKAFGDPRNPMKVTDQSALSDLTDMTMSGAMSFAPAGVIKAPRMSAAQQAALDLAQQRAALPVEQGGLGLAAGNTAEQRAAAMGFDTDAYHATDADIIKFDNAKLGTNTRQNTGGDQEAVESAMLGHWFSDRDLTNKDPRGYMFGDVVYPVKLRKPKKINDKEFGSKSYIVKDPDNIRSRFAAFDPFRRSAAIAATMGVAAPDLLAADLNEEELRKQMQSYGLLY